MSEKILFDDNGYFDGQIALLLFFESKAFYKKDIICIMYNV